jgi:CPA1 family monovalent cation:H+ antiporter
MLEIATVCLVITALLAYLNQRFVGLPASIGVMAGALLLSLMLIAFDRFGFSELRDYETSFVRSIDFSKVLMEGMLSILLFAGALHIDLSRLRDYRRQVALLAIGGTLASTLIIAAGLYWLLPLAGLSLSPVYCLVFGALISPTDPIAVIGILRNSGAPESVQLVVSGESLFNDGVGVVLFSLLVAMAVAGATPTLGGAAGTLAQEAGGGLLLGLVLGWVLFVLLSSINNYKVEVLLTLAGVLGGYQLAQELHLSGPLAMVVAGLVVGNYARTLAMSGTTRLNLDLFWGLLEDILNAVLFVLLGLEIVLVDFSVPVLLASIGVIAITLLARLLVVGAPVAVFHGWFKLPADAWKILTWGGLRGGISVALALSLPHGPDRDLVLSLTYAVVVFSIMGQGLTIRHTVARPRTPAP